MSDCFKQLSAEPGINTWRIIYRVVMGRLKGQVTTQIPCLDLLLKIILSKGRRNAAVIPPVTKKEVLEICSSHGASKAPGLDSIPNKAKQTKAGY